jgi:hypothetical protein
MIIDNVAESARLRVHAVEQYSLFGHQHSLLIAMPSDTTAVYPQANLNDVMNILQVIRMDIAGIHTDLACNVATMHNFQTLARNSWLPPGSHNYEVLQKTVSTL